ncbi:YqzE family protein [Shouchella lonarensis]|uniref:YqzE-like protein n=1 Tax=Shouchella lonarensis TaxID=1464122 RepID=A0A1G6GM14_9BACI|nr:YqzE family protein [Shouchella lonarensis]SDB83072.1 YqzE-like protein [Shouchella lonarensis]
MKFQDLLKFATEEMVKKIEEPQEVRKKARAEKKAQREPLSTWAFGVLPMAFSMFKRRRQSE